MSNLKIAAQPVDAMGTADPNQPRFIKQENHMPHFLFAVELPPIPPGSVGVTVAPAWSKFSSEASTILKPLKTYTQLQPNVWLLPAENALPALLALSSTAEKCTLAYSALLVEGVTELTEKISPGVKRVNIGGV